MDWEYKIVHSGCELDAVEHQTEVLNSYGNSDWELVSVISYKVMEVGSIHEPFNKTAVLDNIYFFKKPKE